MQPEAALGPGTTLLELGGDWALDLNGKQLTTPLKSWEELGTQSFAGPAIYRKQFTAPVVPAGKKVYLEIADARDYVRIRVNGASGLDPKAWQPYRWDITASLQPGNNDLQINVFATLAGRGGPPPAAAGAGAPGAAGAGGGRGGRGGRGQGAPGAAAVYGAVGGGGSRGGGTPPASGLLGPVRLVAR
jgi:hypothetical protein